MTPAADFPVLGTHPSFDWATHVLALSGTAANVTATLRRLAQIRFEVARISPTLAVAWGSGLPALVAETRGVVSRSPSLYEDGSIAPTSFEEALDRFADPDRIAQLALGAPSLALHWGTNRVHVIPDRAGVGAVYHMSSPGLRLVSSSSLLLGWLSGAPLSDKFLMGLAVSGHATFRHTAYAGVWKLPANKFIQLSANNLLEMSFRSAEPPTLAGPDLVRRIVGERASAYPEATVELSGGLDSRLIMAALLSNGEVRSAYTLGVDSSGDVLTAKDITSQLCLPHQIVSPLILNDYEPERLRQHFWMTAHTGECSSNVLDRSITEALEFAYPTTARFNGANGEIIRGFFYAGQPIESLQPGPVARQLLRWRLSANSVSPKIFRNGWLSLAREEYLAEAERVIASYGEGAWASRLDRFYLEERMGRWAGTVLSAVQPRRAALTPFFDHRFISWASGLPPRRKAGPALQASLIRELDQRLAAIPLESGDTPARVALHTRGQGLFSSAVIRKLARKVRGSGHRTDSHGPTQPVWHVLRQELIEKLSSADYEFLDLNQVQRTLDPGSVPSTATVSFLINLAALARF